MNTNNNLKKLRESCGSRVVIDGKSCIAPIEGRDFFDKCLIYSRNKNKHAKESVSWNHMSEEWKENCKNRFWFQNSVEDAKKLHPNMDERMFELKNRLLSFAGDAICLPKYEEDLENILKYGQFWLGYNAEKVTGEACKCHSNSARIWMDNKEITNICTGYSLSADGMWRQHSWLIHRKARSNRIVETTQPRVLYYGFAMTPEMCEEFVSENWW